MILFPRHSAMTLQDSHINLFYKSTEFYRQKQGTCGFLHHVNSRISRPKHRASRPVPRSKVGMALNADSSQGHACFFKDMVYFEVDESMADISLCSNNITRVS